MFFQMFSPVEVVKDQVGSTSEKRWRLHWFVLLSGKLEKRICFPTTEQKPLFLLPRLSQDSQAHTDAAGRFRAQPADWLTPPPKEKLIKLLIQVSFIQNLTFLGN